MTNMILVITGLPGVGKTTICKRIYEEFKNKTTISGFITEEIRERGRRLGFRAINLRTGESVILAHVDLYESSSYRVGKYGVNLKGFENFLERVEEQIPDAKLVIIDEVGKMELFSQKFERLLVRLLDIYSSQRILLFTVNYFYNHPLCIELRESLYDKKFIVTRENREQVLAQLRELLARNLLQ